MNLLSLLGKNLKDDDVMEILENEDIQVIYDFDRTHEGIEDCYWAAAMPAGFQFRFNEQQVLDTVFCYVEADEGFNPIDLSTISVPSYKTFDLAESACREHGLAYNASDASRGPQFYKWWLKVLSQHHGVHYQFKNGRLFRVTLSLNEA